MDSKTEEFIQKAIEKHGNKYDYSKTVYVKCNQKVVIICKEHGEFLQTANDHLCGKGCKKCAVEYTMSLLRNDIKDSIKNMKIIHGDNYDYSLVNEDNYKNTKSKIPILCKIHGIFYQTYYNHMNEHGCPNCAYESRLKSNGTKRSDFIKKSNEIHENRYEYLEVPEYIHLKNTKITINCKIHGNFIQTAGGHLRGAGCSKCGYISCGDATRASNEDFIAKSIGVHGNKYSYNKTKYTNNKTKVIITCPKHGDFTQTPFTHLKGSGCPRCRSSAGEDAIEKYFLDTNTLFYKNHYIKGCKYKKNLFYDFYLPDYKICVEFDGYQHFEPLKCFGGVDAYNVNKIRDTIKNNFCVNNNIGLIRIRYDEINKIPEILTECITHGIRYRGLPIEDFQPPAII